MIGLRAIGKLLRFLSQQLCRAFVFELLLDAASNLFEGGRGRRLHGRDLVNRPALVELRFIRRRIGGLPESSRHELRIAADAGKSVFAGDEIG